MEEVFKAYKDAKMQGFSLLVDPEGKASFMICGSTPNLVMLLNKAFDKNEDFLVTVLATIAERATGDKKLRDLLPGLVDKINESTISKEE